MFSNKLDFYSAFFAVLLAASCGPVEHDRFSREAIPIAPQPVSGQTEPAPSQQPRATSPPGESLEMDGIFGDDQPETKQDQEAARRIPKEPVFHSPLSGQNIITDFYGPRVLGKSVLNFHAGVDFSAKEKTPVRAIGRGTVYIPAMYSGCGGWIMVLKHDLPTGPVFSLYEHLTPPKNKKGLTLGSAVNEGDVIALSGKSGEPLRIVNGVKSGCVAGAHLHLELRIPVDLAQKLPSSPEERYNMIFDHKRPWAKVNPADFIFSVDQECQKRKNIELDNARILARWHNSQLPPITAGRCGLKYESGLRDVPAIYLFQGQ